MQTLQVVGIIVGAANALFTLLVAYILNDMRSRIVGLEDRERTHLQNCPVPENCPVAYDRCPYYIAHQVKE
jgi:hypothetical protein